MAQQTAIEYLIEQLWGPCRGIPSDVIEKAKQMEEKQHNNTFLAGGKSAWNAVKGVSFKTFEEYYKETYGTE